MDEELRKRISRDALREWDYSWDYNGKMKEAEVPLSHFNGVVGRLEEDNLRLRDRNLELNKKLGEYEGMIKKARDKLVEQDEVIRKLVVRDRKVEILC